MKTYHIEINRNHVTNVEAVSEIAALKIFIEELKDQFYLIGDTESLSETADSVLVVNLIILLLLMFIIKYIELMAEQTN